MEQCSCPGACWRMGMGMEAAQSEAAGNLCTKTIIWRKLLCQMGTSQRQVDPERDAAEETASDRKKGFSVLKASVSRR